MPLPLDTTRCLGARFGAVTVEHCPHRTTCERCVELRRQVPCDPMQLSPVIAWACADDRFAMRIEAEVAHA